MKQSMNKWEKIAGWCYFAFQLLVLPEILGLLDGLLPKPLGDPYLKIIWFCVNFVAIVGIFHRYLWNSLKAACRRLWRTVKSAFLAFCVYYVSAMLVNSAIGRWAPWFSNVNDQNIRALVAQNYAAMAFCVVVLVPVVEEMLYRGLLFGSLYAKNKYLGYIASVAIFALVHVLGYVGDFSWTHLLLCFLQYLPAGAALAWAYVESDTIWAPILMHMTSNLLSIAAMR